MKHIEPKLKNDGKFPLIPKEPGGEVSHVLTRRAKNGDIIFDTQGGRYEPVLIARDYNAIGYIDRKAFPAPDRVRRFDYSPYQFLTKREGVISYLHAEYNDFISNGRRKIEAIRIVKPFSTSPLDDDCRVFDMIIGKFQFKAKRIEFTEEVRDYPPFGFFFTNRFFQWQDEEQYGRKEDVNGKLKIGICEKPKKIFDEFFEIGRKDGKFHFHLKMHIPQ